MTIVPWFHIKNLFVFRKLIFRLNCPRKGLSIKFATKVKVRVNFPWFYVILTNKRDIFRSFQVIFSCFKCSLGKAEKFIFVFLLNPVLKNYWTSQFRRRKMNYFFIHRVPQHGSHYMSTADTTECPILWDIATNLEADLPHFGRNGMMSKHWLEMAIHVQTELNVQISLQYLH